MKIEDLTETQKTWYHALWNETGGAISPAAVATLYPDASSAPVSGLMMPLSIEEDDIVIDEPVLFDIEEDVEEDIDI